MITVSRRTPTKNVRITRAARQQLIRELIVALNRKPPRDVPKDVLLRKIMNETHFSYSTARQLIKEAELMADEKTEIEEPVRRPTVTEAVNILIERMEKTLPLQSSEEQEEDIQEESVDQDENDVDVDEDENTVPQGEGE